MSKVGFNKKNGVFILAKEENDIALSRGDLAVIKSEGRLKTVSETDFKSLVTGEKEATLSDGNVVLSDVLSDGAIHNYSQTAFTAEKDLIKGMVDKFLVDKEHRLNLSEFSGLKTRLTAFQTALANFDDSSITFPVTTSFLRYWYDNETAEPFSYSFLH